jgi:hypothetical protein
MNERMTVDEMKERFVCEWVLVGNPQEDESLEIISGIVLFHSRDADEVYHQALKLRPGEFATIFTGELPVDLEFAL